MVDIFIIIILILGNILWHTIVEYRKQKYRQQRLQKAMERIRLMELERIAKARHWRYNRQEQSLGTNYRSI
jgi:hypothetical protein